MYHLILRRRVARMFEGLSRGEWQPLVASLAERVHHVFPGVHPLGGERHTREGVQRWFERLERLFPEHGFQVRRVSSHGWPWSAWVAVRWSARLRPAVGEPYLNQGTHWLHIRWRKVTGVHAYLDTQIIAEACLRMAQRGVSEAAAEPIGDLITSKP